MLLLALACAPEAPADRPPNVILIAMDTVRWDATTPGGAEGATPNLEAFAALPGATTYTRAWAAAAWSLPSYVSVFTGQSVRAHQVGFSLDSLPPGQPTLAEMLGAYGYTSAGWSSGPHLAPDTGVGRGFDRWNHQVEFTSMAGFVEPALAWATEQEDPFLLFVQGYDAHMPYSAPSAVAEHFDHPDNARPDLACAGRRNATCPSNVKLAKARGGPGQSTIDPREVEHYQSHYKAAVYTSDHQLGRMLYGLDQRGLLNDSVVVVFSDHGELVGDERIGDSVFHVPLVVRIPTDAPPTRSDGLVSLTDLLPSLAGELGLVAPAGIDGVPLADRDVLIAAAVTTWCVRDEDWELEVPRNDPDNPVLRVPGTTVPIEDRPDEVAELAAHLEGWPLLVQAGEEQVRHGPDNPQLREALREGGYWAPPPEEEP